MRLRRPALSASRAPVRALRRLAAADLGARAGRTAGGSPRLASAARPSARAASSRAHARSRRSFRTPATARANSLVARAPSPRAARATGRPRESRRRCFSSATTSSSQLAGASGAIVAARSAARQRFRVVAELVVRDAEQIERFGYRLGLVRDERVEHARWRRRSPRLDECGGIVDCEVRRQLDRV